MSYPLSIEEIIKKFALQPNKKLGQNFLLDSDITDNIVRYAGNLKDYNVLEIGPGAGTLTRSILFAKAKAVTAIEMDARCSEAIRDLQSFHPELHLIEGDALKLDFKEICIGSPWKIIANLPYNIGSELLLKFLNHSDLFSSITIMLQKEVVDRLIAQPGSKAYGRLSIITQLLAKVEKNCDIDPMHFFPPPKIISSVITLVPHKAPLYACGIQKLSMVTNLLFQQRRKMIRAILKSRASNIEELLLSLNISPTARPEELTIEQFCSLAEQLKI